MRNIFYCGCFVLCSIQLSAQTCGFTVAAYPYFQNFEATDGGWISGGTADDWAWGTPTKSVINTAGDGVRCWITGGLNKTSYNDGERSWLMSPCFDFSTLQYPVLSFKVFWDTERNYDGATLQYSKDNGTTWLPLGAYASPADSCQAANWFNTQTITYLFGWQGWTGNTRANAGICLGGGGSAGWKDAWYSLGFLAGNPSVRFRFSFGAGTTCNAYDGFAVDAIRIAEAAPNVAAFTATCRNQDEMDFAFDAPCATSFAWNFGDAGSGTQNTGTGANISHTFSAPGLYTVSVTANFITGPPATTSKQVTILGVQKNISWPGRCANTPDATIGVTVSGGTGPYIYAWDTNPSQSTSSISNVGAGSYTVIINAANACAAKADFVLTATNSMLITSVVTNAACSQRNGSISTNISGGAAPYKLLWNNGDTTADIKNLAPGAYSLVVTDVNGCSRTHNPLPVELDVNNLKINLGPDLSICPGQSVTLDAGVFNSYLWQDGSSKQTLTLNKAGQYFVTVTDSRGCAAKDTLLVSADCSNIYFPTAFTPNKDGSNDYFGPVGNLSALQNYQLSIFDRYGNLVFRSKDPYQKWDGRVKMADPNSGNFVWVSSFLFNGEQQLRKGSILLLR